MTVRMTPQAQLDAVQRTLRAEMQAGELPMQNVEAATTAHDTGWVEYRGRRYLVPPVPFRHGLILAALHQQVQRLVPRIEDLASAATADLEAFLDLVTPLLDTMGRCVRPRWRDRLWGWLTRRPFAPFEDAEADEVATLLRFFSTPRTTSPVRACTSMTALPRYRRTWGTHSPDLSPATPAGWTAMVTRVVGGTSALGSTA